MNNETTQKSEFRTLSEAELDGVDGGMIKQPGPERLPALHGNGGGELIEATPWSSHPIYLGPSAKLERDGDESPLRIGSGLFSGMRGPDTSACYPGNSPLNRQRARPDRCATQLCANRSEQ